MAGSEFFLTGMGRKFFEGTMPALVQELRKLNENLSGVREIILYGSKVPAADREAMGLRPEEQAVKMQYPSGWHTNLLKDLAREAWENSEPGAHVVGEHLLDTRVDHTNGHKTDEMKYIKSVVRELEGIERWAHSIRMKLSEEL